MFLSCGSAQPVSWLAQLQLTLSVEEIEPKQTETTELKEPEKKWERR